MASLNKVLRDLVLLPNEKIIDAVPASTDGWVTSYHREMAQELKWGFAPSYTSRAVPDFKYGKISGFFIFTQWRMLFVADDKKHSRHPEIMYDVPLHNVEEISARGIMEKTLHVDAHTTQGVSHFTFYGPKVAAQASFFREAVRVHDAADYWRSHVKLSPQKCRKCRRHISKGLKYCPYCGTQQMR